MKSSSKQIALCGLLAALGIVILLLAGWIGVGTYIGPMLAGLLLLPVQSKYSTKLALTLWAAMGLLSLFLVTDTEETLIFLAFFGWYPALRHKLENLPAPLRWPIKELAFNLPMIAVELLAFFVLAPGAMTWIMLVVILVLLNLVFLVYDRALPRVEALMMRKLKFL